MVMATPNAFNAKEPENPVMDFHVPAAAEKDSKGIDDDQDWRRPKDEFAEKGRSPEQT
jgi:hypothetical protein